MSLDYNSFIERIKNVNPGDDWPLADLPDPKEADPLNSPKTIYSNSRAGQVLSVLSVRTAAHGYQKTPARVSFVQPGVPPTNGENPCTIEAHIADSDVAAWRRMAGVALALRCKLSPNVSRGSNTRYVEVGMIAGVEQPLTASEIVEGSRFGFVHGTVLKPEIVDVPQQSYVVDVGGTVLRMLCERPYIRSVVGPSAPELGLLMVGDAFRATASPGYVADGEAFHVASGIYVFPPEQWSSEQWEQGRESTPQA